MSIGYEDFRRAVGQPASVGFPPGAAVEGMLTGCSELTTSGGWQSFTLTFTAPGPSAQATATVALPGLAPVDIFLVPVAERDGSVEYEAIFNQPEEG